jgi:hypothetical protein
VYQNIRPIGHCWLYFFLPRPSRGDEKKNFYHFFFKISDSNLAYFVENFIAILTVSLKFLAIENYAKKIEKPGKIEKSSKNEMCPVDIGILFWCKNVHSGLKLKLFSSSWSAPKLIRVDFYRSFNDEKNDHFWGFSKNSVFLRNFFSQMCFLVEVFL